VSAIIEPAADTASLALDRAAAPAHVAVGTRRRPLHIALHVAFITLCLVYLLPFAWMLSTSLKLDGREIAMPPEWIPNPVVWSNYYRAMTGLPMFLYLQNTLIITITATTLGVFTASLAGFGFARLRFPGRDVLFSLCLATLMLPGIVTMIPEFLIYRQIGWINTFLPLIVPWVLGRARAGDFPVPPVRHDDSAGL